MLKSIFSGLRQWFIFIRLAVAAAQVYEISQNSSKIRTNSSSSSSKVIDCQSKTHMQLSIKSLIVTARISNRLRDINTFSSNIACFLPPRPCSTPIAEGRSAIST